MSYIPSRYTIIPEEANITTINPLSILNKTNIERTTNYPHEGTQLVFSASPEVNYLIIIIVSVIILAVVLLAIAPVPTPSTEGGHLIYGRSRKLSRAETHEYVYEGVKKILREIYLRLRERHRCYICTPRELSLRSIDERINLIEFADTYERIVYGDKRPSGRDIESLKKWSS
ncbi:MAG: hypothetical protein ACP5GI_07485 [Sulfolobales archaeon]